MQVVIIGGVAAGAATAARLRRLDEKIEITVIEKGAYPSFANCALPFFVGGELSSRESLFAVSAEYLETLYRLKLLLNTEALSIDTDAHKVLVRGQDGTEKQIKYDKLIIATGSRCDIPRKFACKRVMALKTVPDADLVRSYVDSGARKAVIVGAGPIGLECTEALRSQGLKVLMCEATTTVLPKMDCEISHYASKALQDHAVQVKCNCKVTNVEEETDGLKVTFDDGSCEKTDFMIWGAGTVPNTEFAVAAGLKANARGYLITDEYMQSSDQDIFVAGDAALVRDAVNGQLRPSGLATPISKQVRALCSKLTNSNLLPCKPDCGTFIVKIFDTALGSCGLSYEQSLKADPNATYVCTHSFNHASFYPEASRIHAKLCFSKKSGKIYGIQAAGDAPGVDKLIEAVSTLIGMHGNVYDLSQRSQAYAPPFSAVRDPACMIGAVAENVMNGLLDVIGFEQLSEYKDAFKIDVRPSTAFAKGHPQGFINIPAAKIRNELDKIPEDKTVIISCLVGQTAYICARILKSCGYKDVKVLTGSLLTLEATDMELENEKQSLSKE